MDPVSQNVEGVRQLVASKLNKTEVGASGAPEGPKDEQINELELKMSDEELIKLSKMWTAKYATYEAKIKLRQDANKMWYLGRQKESGTIATTDGQPISPNLLFEAEETFLPAALAKNPEPVVWSDNTEAGTKLSSDIKTMLQYHADILSLRRKLTLMTRHWSIYFIGVLKHGWDESIEEITTEVRKPQDFILDPDGFVDCYGNFEGYTGERVTVPASTVVELFPKHKEYITIAVDGKMGTLVTYTEWWTDEYCFYTFKEKVLEKNKNPHYNHPQVKQKYVFDRETGTVGKESEEIKGRNHFARPAKPYTFLSVFSLQEQPHDVTSLIEQNIPNQRKILRRTEQIDYNLSRQNNSDVFSADNFNQETAKQASSGMAKGHPLLIPSGRPINEAIQRMQTQGVHQSYFNELETTKNDLRSIFGTAGITATDKNEEETARGMILKTQYDNSRIGGGIGDALQQVADNVFNWWVQLYYVYYDEPHVAAIMGQMRATEYVQLTNEAIDRKVVVSVAPDSMKPHDELTEMNQALSLYQANALDPKTLLTRLNFPDPQNTAAQTVLWLTDKNAYMALNFPELMGKLQQQQMMQQQMQGGMPGQGAGAVSDNIPGAVGQGQVPAQPPPSTGQPIPSASLNQVPLPK